MPFLRSDVLGMHRFRSLSIVTLLLASCVAWSQEDGGFDFSVYEVDHEGSHIRLLVHRAGGLSWFGHSHVISVGGLSGSIRLYPESDRSHFELEIPVRQLVVDDPLLRREEGDEFSSQVSEKDITRTRNNMLGERVLKAERYPIVKLTGTGARGDGPQLILDVMIEFLGSVVELQVPATLSLDAGILEVTGAFALSHSDLGMQPFSAMWGAIRVADEIDFRFRIKAHEKVPEKVPGSLSAD